MIFCYVSGTFGGYNQVLQPAILPEKTNYISIKSNTAKKKITPLPLYKIGNPQTEELPPLYKIRKPNKEALQGTCVTLLFYGVLICYFCSILHVFFHRFQYYFVGVTCPSFTGETTVGAQPLETVGHQPPGETQRVTTKGRHHSVYDFKMSSICCGLVI